MDVVSICSLPVAKLVWQPHAGAHRLTVVCKATFLLAPPTATLAPEQDEPHEYDNHWNDDARRSLYAASDLAPFKPRADVTLVGHAFAPGGASVRSLITRLRVGSIDKAVEVYCDRIYRPDGTLDEGPPFKRMQVVYERAAGGPDTTNPVGMRVDSVDPYGRIAIPNVQLPGRRITLLADLLEPIGFGPVAATWPTRRERLGRSADAWSPRDLATKPLPEGLDPSFFNIAPPDQQLEELRGDELIMLENLHRDHMLLRVQLPGLRPIATLERPGRASSQVKMRCDTLWIDTDRARCALTWRGQISLEKPDEAGRIIVSMEEEERREWRRDPEASEPPSSEDEPNSVTTSRLDMALAVSDTEMGRPRAEEEDPNATTGRLLARSHTAAAAAAAAAPAAAPAPAPAVPEAPAPPPAARPRSPNVSLSAASRPPPTASVPSASRPPPTASVPSASRPPPTASVPSASRPSSANLSSTPLPAPRLARSTERPPSVATSPPAAAPAVPPVRATQRPAARDAGARVVELLWFEPESVPRIRRKPSFRVLLANLVERPLDADLDEPSPARGQAALVDRRDVFEVVALAEAASFESVGEALEGGVRADGKFVPPLALIAGELHFPFDELATLQATLTTVTPLAGNDENLKAAIEVSRDFLKTPGLSSAPAVAEGVTKQLKDAFGQSKRAVPAGYLEAQTARALLEQRHYQRRVVFGGTHLRALLQGAELGGADRSSTGPKLSGLPVYLKDELSTRLPLYQRLSVRMIVEVHLPADQYETCPAALRVVALGRVSTSPRG